jgi:pyridoxamine 5'-phosphate oxidase family protein
MDPAPFTDAELVYLSSQRLGRLATVAPDGAPQNNPVGFHYNAAVGTVDIFGFNMGATRKFRNIRTNSRVALVVDDVASVDPWEVRGIEIRGVAEAIHGAEAPRSGISRQVICVHPRRIIAWNVDPTQPGMQGRDLTESPRVA